MKAGLLAPRTLMGLALASLAGCATLRPDCYPFVYLDSRFLIRGRHAGTGEPTPDPACYQLVHDRDGRVVSVDYRRDGRLNLDPLSGVARMTIEYSGRSEKRVHLDALGNPTPNRDGVYTIWIERDPQGNPVEWRNLGPDSRPQEERVSGVAIVRWRYDERGNATEQGYFGADEQPRDHR